MGKAVFTAILACACIVSCVTQTKKRTEDASWKSAVSDPVAKTLARPGKAQYDWQEMERAMFVQLDPATIQEGEYDNGTTKMEDIRFEADKNQTQAADDPDGDYWAPHEADTPLQDKFWPFRPDALNHRKSVEQLMDCYLKSIGRNSFLILNCAPMADGSIHPDDIKRYKEFGKEIERCFGHPVARVEKVPGNEVLLKLDKPCSIAYTDLREDYQYGQRIRAYEIEGRDATTGNWIKIAEGTKVAFKKENYKFVFSVPANYKNENDVIIELVIKGSTAEMALMKSVID